MKNTSKIVSVIIAFSLIMSFGMEVFAGTTKTTTTSTTVTQDITTTTTTVTTEHIVTTTSGTPANNPSSDVAASTSGTGTGKSTTATTTTKNTKVSNFTSLRHKTALEKKAYKSLKKIENLAKKHGWTVKRTYTREKLAKKYKKVWCITDVYIQSAQYNWSFRHCQHKSGKVVYQWKGKTIAQKDVYGLIKNPSKYYK